MRLIISEIGKLCPAGQIWPTTCFCMTGDLRMVFTLFFFFFLLAMPMAWQFPEPGIKPEPQQ